MVLFHQQCSWFLQGQNENFKFNLMCTKLKSASMICGLLIMRNSVTEEDSAILDTELTSIKKL
jgi:hypothetical protein